MKEITAILFFLVEISGGQFLNTNCTNINDDYHDSFTTIYTDSVIISIGYFANESIFSASITNLYSNPIAIDTTNFIANTILKLPDSMIISKATNHPWYFGNLHGELSLVILKSNEVCHFKILIQKSQFPEVVPVHYFFQTGYLTGDNVKMLKENVPISVSSWSAIINHEIIIKNY